MTAKTAGFSESGTESQRLVPLFFSMPTDLLPVDLRVILMPATRDLFGLITQV